MINPSICILAKLLKAFCSFKPGKLLLAMLMALPLFVGATTYSTQVKQLNQLRQQIKDLKQEQATAQKQASKTSNGLKKLQQQINTRTKRLHQLQLQTKSLLTELENSRDIVQITDESATYMADLANRQLYHLWQQQVFNPGQQPKFLGLLWADTAHRAADLQKLKTELMCQAVGTERLADNLSTNGQKLAQQRAAYLKKLDSQQAYLKGLNRSLTRQETRLQSLLGLEQDLLALLDELIWQDRQTGPQFIANSLPWPALGNIAKMYDQDAIVPSNGIDIELTPKTKVRCVADGLVAWSGWRSQVGKLVVVDHQNGWFSLYSGNSMLMVTRGDKVAAGQVVGLSGNNPFATKPGLHFELRKGGIPVNPVTYLEKLYD